MSSQTERGASIFDDALACISDRISIILLQASDKDKNYIASLHNEVLAAVWILGLTSGGSSAIPESVRVVFGSFSNIRDPGSYTAPSGSQLPQGKVQPSDSPRFNFTEWWKIEGENMRKPFDVCDEVVVGLLHAVEMRQQEASAQLRDNIINKLEEVQEKVITLEGDAKGINEMLQTGVEKVEKVFHRLEAKEKEARHQDS
ncbi:hypothetical protein EI94DRAFT_1703534 [Lactarius quietus]|nr:hypothetical protein EI94DRAFT_1703534 [Lactarius quietus]